MELKQRKDHSQNQLQTVLIVPSGIETRLVVRLHLVFVVLIVPSGIETSLRTRRFRETKTVLIVPSGIETLEITSRVRLRTVLIVPSGIETLFTGMDKESVTEY